MPRPSSLTPDARQLTPAFARRLDEFATYLREERGAARHTVINYESDLRQFACWLRGDGGLLPQQGWRHVTYLMVRRYVNFLGKENYSRTSMVRKFTAIKGFFKWMEREGHNSVNPALQVVIPKANRAAPEVLSIAEIERMLEMPDLLDAAGKRDRALLEVLYATGMRSAECANLALRDIDWRVGEVQVRDGDGRIARTIPLGRPALLALRDYLQNARPELLRYRERRQAEATDKSASEICEALWLSRRGLPMTALAVHMVVKQYARRAGIAQNVTPNSLRQACAAHLLQNGADLRVVQELLGHRVAISTRFYAQPGNDNLKRAAGSGQSRAYSRKSAQHAAQQGATRSRRRRV